MCLLPCHSARSRKAKSQNPSSKKITLALLERGGPSPQGEGFPLLFEKVDSATPGQALRAE